MPPEPEARPLTKSSPVRGCVGVKGHQPQHPRRFRVLRLVFDTAALREDDFVNGLEPEAVGQPAPLRLAPPGIVFLDHED